jgi:hypothetical protein
MIVTSSWSTMSVNMLDIQQHEVTAASIMMQSREKNKVIKADWTTDQFLNGNAVPLAAMQVRRLVRLHAHL